MITTINAIDSESGKVKGSMDLEIRAFPLAEPKGKVKGYASVTINDTFGVHNISIVEGKNGLFVAMPQIKDKNGEYHDIFHPLTKESRLQLNNAVLEEFGVSLDTLSTARESTVEKLREAATSAKTRPLADKTVDREAPGESRFKPSTDR